MIAVFVTLVVVVATLLILVLNVAFTGMFTEARPMGERAMAMIVPIFGLPIAIVALTLAALLATGHASTSAMGTLAPTAFRSGVLVVALTFGASLASGMAFMLWCEPAAVARRLEPITAPFGMIAGVCGPIVVAVMLLVGVWMSRSSAAEALGAAGAKGVGLKVGFGAVCVLGVTGYTLGGSMLWMGLRRRAANRAAAIASALEREAAWEARRNKTPKERIQDDFAEFAPTTPFWCVATYFLDESSIKGLDDECRAVIVERALRVPELDEQLHGCMQGTYAMYREAAALFLLHVSERDLAIHRDAWGRALVAGLRVTSESFARAPDWLSRRDAGNPDPLGVVRALVGAAGRFKDWSEFPAVREQMRAIADNAAALNADSLRDELLGVLAGAGISVSAKEPDAVGRGGT